MKREHWKSAMQSLHTCMVAPTRGTQTKTRPNEMAHPFCTRSSACAPLTLFLYQGSSAEDKERRVLRYKRGDAVHSGAMMSVPMNHKFERQDIMTSTQAS